MGRTSLTIAALVTGVLVTGSFATGCATAEAAPAVRPVNVVLVNAGGADPPSGEYTALVVSCGEDLKAGRDADCEDTARAATLSPDKEVAAAGTALQYVSQVNQGKYEEARQTLRNAERSLRSVDRSSRRPMTELVYRAEAIAYAATGDQEAADDATRTAQEAAPDERADEIRAERCRAAPTAPSCAGTTGSPAPTSAHPTGASSTKAPATEERTTEQTGGGEPSATNPPPSN